MPEPHQPVGFFALWLNKDSEYHAGPEEERETAAQINQAFANARARHIRMFGRYGCRWSAERQYFTFWQSPGLEALEATMDDLERAGDFKFADSEHIIGVRVADEEMTGEDLPASGEEDSRYPLAFFAIWRRKDSAYRASPQEWDASDKAVRRVFDAARAQGVRMLGRYDCTWSTAWDFFTFWLVPSFEILESIIDQLEAVGDFQFADSRHVIGVLEPRYRFGWHVQGEAH